MLFVVFISLAFLAPATIARAATVGETYSATLEVLEPGSPSLPSRDRHQTRQSADIAVSAGAVLEARVTNNQEVVFNLVGIGSGSDTNQVLPANGAWTRVTAKQDAGVFFRLRDSNSWTAAPQVEYRVVSGEVFDMPAFTLGEDTTAFADEWEASGSPFAIIDDESMTMLIPVGDRQRIRTLATATEFANLNQVVEFYRTMIAKYDEWLGINNDPATPWNHGGNGSYFIRGDVNGYGAAYFADHQHVGQNGGSVSYYLASPNSWLILHEIGHGLDGIMWDGVDNRDFQGAEVWNNVYASNYQSLVNKVVNTTNYSNGKEASRERITNDVAAAIKKGGSINNVDLGHRLDFLLRITEKTGMEGLAGFNQRLRAAQANGLNADATRRNDMLNQWLGVDNGFNTTAWFESNGLTITPAERQIAMDKTPRPLLMPLNNFVPADRLATATTQLGLATRYDLVTPQELAPLGLTTAVTVKAQGDPSTIEGRSVTLWDGSRKVATAAFVNGTAQFANVPVGTYTVRYPYDTKNFAPVSDWVTAGHNGGLVDVVYGEVFTNDDLGSVKFSLRGLGSSEFAALTYQHSTRSLIWADKGYAPHSYFNTAYQRTTITAPGGEVLLDETLTGDVDKAARTLTFKAPVGTKITLWHAEAESRMVPLQVVNKAVVDGLKIPRRQSVTFVVTQYGIERVDQPGTALPRFAEEVRGEAHKLIAESKANPDGAYAQQAAVLVKAVNSMPQEQQLAAMWDYAIWLDFLLQTSRR